MENGENVYHTSIQPTEPDTTSDENAGRMIRQSEWKISNYYG
jgi:hypothetical protein